MYCTRAKICVHFGNDSSIIGKMKGLSITFEFDQLETNSFTLDSSTATMERFQRKYMSCLVLDLIAVRCTNKETNKHHYVKCICAVAQYGSSWNSYRLHLTFSLHFDGKAHLLPKLTFKLNSMNKIEIWFEIQIEHKVQTKNQLNMCVLSMNYLWLSGH